MAEPQRFFFYGTLMACSEHPLARRLHRLLRSLGPGYLPGRLVALPDRKGWYPALTDGEGRVAGEVYVPRRGSLTPHELAALDRYEGCLRNARLRSDYWRATLGARLVARVGLQGADLRPRLAVQAYVWSGVLPRAAVPIEDGDFAAWLARTGARAYAGG
ncbi:gamma-glutamylcyclotransferase [Novosphingobium sp. YJ-S2-02]|uniref:Gamma-glutamylcyclotransferase n=1 Tax=Novosphingobium aureum TaxID=2792964 RepID=A0A931HF97_9SPHN|nr:gamma-glutamylcyclotransferase family protein [Novosphingobium aureum]MBH0114709.1 gamma-glutamylcyclotransferase [Novosphingobium aureum]